MSRGLFSWRDYAPFFSVSLSSCLAQKGTPRKECTLTDGISKLKTKRRQEWLEVGKEQPDCSVGDLTGDWGTHSLTGVPAVWNIRWERGDGSVLISALPSLCSTAVIACTAVFQAFFHIWNYTLNIFPWLHGVASPISFPWSAREARPLQWKHWILTTRPPGNFLHYGYFFNYTHYEFCFSSCCILHLVVVVDFIWTRDFII